MLRGICMANGSTDLEKANQFGAEYYRLTIPQAIEMDGKIDKPYMLLGPGASNDDDYIYLADKILSTWNKLKQKPQVILCSNEQNELSYRLAKNVRRYLSSHDINVPIAKGPFTCCVERAGRKKYKELNIFDQFYIPEILNYYERPHWEFWSFIENFRRRWRLKCIVKKLKNAGVKTIMISEAHDGSMNKKGMMDHGDYVYASKKGWDSICKYCEKLGIEVICYYMAPFIGKDGNDVRN